MHSGEGSQDSWCLAGTLERIWAGIDPAIASDEQEAERLAAEELAALRATSAHHVQAELATVLARPRFRRWVALTDAIAFVDALEREAELATDPPAVPRRVRDTNDDYLVGLAEAASATIITGDADLLVAGLEPPAITPRQLLDRLGGVTGP